MASREGESGPALCEDEFRKKLEIAVRQRFERSRGRERVYYASVQTRVAAGIVDVACKVGERYGITRTELLQKADLEASDLDDPSAAISGDALVEICLHILGQTQDRSLGIRFAEAMDLRTQGFWGYLFISCLTVRQAAELLVRFQQVRHTSRISFREERDWAVFEREQAVDVPPEFKAIGGDAYLATFCFHRRRWIPGAHGEMQAWLPYPEEPHHRELRELVGGPVTFDAPLFRHRIPAWELDLPIRAADPHLLRLAQQQLEKQLANLTTWEDVRDVGKRVRAIVAKQMAEGIHIERVAYDLRLSVRTLRRRLSERGLSFDGLLTEVRRNRAVAYLVNTDEAIERIAERLGYSDASNFRRAFRRWTGLAPAAFRAERRPAQSRARKS